MAEELFGAGGLLARYLPGYEPRPQQVQMAAAVQEALRSRGRAIIEAATGTGKTLAYLIPALLSGQRVIVSTATKALQEQIFFKDIPFLQKLFTESDTKRPFKAVYLKGRSNYLCKFRMESWGDQILFRSRDEAVLFKKIKQWAKVTKTGDRADIPGMPSDYAPWTQVTASAQQCHGQSCEFYKECFVNRLRWEAQEADLIVVNHHLFFADLAIKNQDLQGILPEYDAVVFDEAHHLEATISSFFGLEVSSHRIQELVQDVRRAVEAASRMTTVGAEKIGDVEREAFVFWEGFFGVEGRKALDEVMQGELGAEARRRYVRLRESLEALAAWIEKADLGEVVERLVSRCNDLLGELDEILEQRHASMVYMAERRGKSFTLLATPLDVASLFRKHVLSRGWAQVYASATLTAGGDFQFFLRSLGIEPHEAKTLCLPPVFDYPNKALVYVPKKLPEPQHPDFLDGVCQIIPYLLKTTEGRAFVLFTSHRNMEEVYARMQKEGFAFKLLKQGDASHLELLQTFREDVHSVLFATHSFWEGVDVEGEALSLVIIDKLPFASPDDPVIRARLKLLESQGRDPFADWTVPQAAITLRQGFGRLIRSQRDTGIVAILDSRVTRKRYGQVFLDSLPPAPVVFQAKDVRQWWQAGPR
jgi:ATP-dependent DNA helicase DinG